METKICGLSGIRIAATLIGVIYAGAAGAQLPSAGGNNLPRPRTQAVATEPGAPAEELALIVVRPVKLREQVPTGPLLAQVNLPPERTLQTLPDTAGPLPLFALAGLISLLAGLVLTISRRFLARK